MIQLGALNPDHIEQKMHDPATLRRELEQIEQAAANGQITEEEPKKNRI